MVFRPLDDRDGRNQAAGMSGLHHYLYDGNRGHDGRTADLNGDGGRDSRPSRRTPSAANTWGDSAYVRHWDNVSAGRR